MYHREEAAEKTSTGNVAEEGRERVPTHHLNSKVDGLISKLVVGSLLKTTWTPGAL